MDCVLCHQPAELDFDGVPVCKDCWSLQGSTCAGPLYRLVQDKRKIDSGQQEADKPVSVPAGAPVPGSGPSREAPEGSGPC